MSRTAGNTPAPEKLHDDIALITTELQQVIPAATLAAFELADVGARRTRRQDGIEARILALASAVANDVYAATMYSSFHEWEAFYDVGSKAAASKLAPGLVGAMRPLGNCLTMAAECCDMLRGKLRDEGPEFARYVGRVQLVANNWRRRVGSAREYHCMVILRLPGHCIVVDAVACGTATCVPLGELATAPGCSSLGFVYVGIGAARLLVEYEPHAPCYSLARPRSRGRFEYDDPYADIEGGFAGAVRNLAFPSVNYHVRGQLPSRRTILIHQTWTEQPRNVDSFEELQDGSGWVVETGQMRVDFAKREVLVEKIPYATLKQRQQTRALMGRLSRGRGVLRLPLVPTYAAFAISLAGQGDVGWDPETLRRLRLMDEMCAALGLPEGEVLRIAGVMQGVWMDHEEAKTRSGKRGRGRAKAVRAGRTERSGSGKEARV